MYELNKKSLSWVESANGSLFPIQNLPFGIFSSGNEMGVCTRIGDFVLNIAALSSKNNFFKEVSDDSIFNNQYLNDFIALGKETTSAIRLKIAELLDLENALQKDLVMDCLIPITRCTLHLPLKIGNYTDFYSSKEHATNVGTMFRDPNNALFPNWVHIPIGYHGRASSIVVSGTSIKRPHGQIILKDGDSPIYSESKQLDFELEMSFVIGKSNDLGYPIPIQEARDHIFGLMLFNDWSARDIQKWEYVPLGPFLSKNFASTVSPWIVTLEALENFRTEGPLQNPEPLPYLHPESNRNYNIELEVYLNDVPICKSNTKYLYWSISQQLAHHTVNGCNVQVGDVCASGTISGPDAFSYGSMLELCWKGTKPIILKDGSSRTFIQDGDIIRMEAYAQGDQYRIGFGECTGKIIG